MLTTIFVSMTMSIFHFTIIFTLCLGGTVFVIAKLWLRRIEKEQSATGRLSAASAYRTHASSLRLRQNHRK